MCVCVCVCVCVRARDSLLGRLVVNQYFLIFSLKFYIDTQLSPTIIELKYNLAETRSKETSLPGKINPSF